MGYPLQLDHLTDGTAREIDAELERARKKFPGTRHQYVALAEEVGEIARALLEGASGEKLRAECIQVAAMAVRIADEGDADFERGPSRAVWRCDHGEVIGAFCDACRAGRPKDVDRP